MNTKYLETSIHSHCGKAVDMVIKSSLIRKSLDNVTCLIIAFKNFENCYDLLNCDKLKNFDKVPAYLAPSQSAKGIKLKTLVLQIQEEHKKDKEKKTEEIEKAFKHEIITEKEKPVVYFDKKMEDYKVNNERPNYEQMRPSSSLTPNQKTATKTIIDNKKQELITKNSNGDIENFYYSPNQIATAGISGSEIEKFKGDYDKYNENKLKERYIASPKLGGVACYSTKVGSGQVKLNPEEYSIGSIRDYKEYKENYQNIIPNQKFAQYIPSTNIKK